ncbi:MAG: S41 family peptidase [Paludibacteraceae bacterium]|nr:S41 family peptidase [Paludibacteraceae bacterium]
MKTRSFFCGILIILTSVQVTATESKSTRINKNLNIYNDVYRQLDINYVDTLDYDKLTKISINEMLRQVDPYTVYIPKEEDDNLKLMTTGKYGGIGAIIMQRDSFVCISEPYENMPAQENEVLAGDKILSIDGTNCKGKTTKEVSDMLRGVPGTTVTLKLERPGVDKPFTKVLTRKEIHMPPVSYYTTYGETGYVLFSEFTSGSAQEVLKAVEEMIKSRHITGLVLDLRGNGGGLVDEAIQLVSYFVDKGTMVVSTKGKTQQSNREYTTKTSPIYKDLPIAVLVDGRSASAAEIVSGCFQDLHRATLIGQRTFGKGLVQSIRPIAFDGHLKVTTAHYYLPSGRCIQAIDYSELQKGNKLHKDTAGGILPDIVMTDSAKVDITYSLYQQQMFFDYSVLYHSQHAAIAAPEEFELSDQELEDFIAFLDSRHYSYQTETGKYMHDVIEMAKHEDLDSVTIADLQAFEQRLKPSYRDAIMRNKEDVKRLLSEEIIERYYFQKGRIAYVLRFDKELKKALEIL